MGLTTLTTLSDATDAARSRRRHTPTEMRACAAEHFIPPVPVDDNEADAVAVALLAEESVRHTQNAEGQPRREAIR